MYYGVSTINSFVPFSQIFGSKKIDSPKGLYLYGSVGEC